MKIAICQMNVVQGEKETNRASAKQMIAQAAAEGADVAVLPEMWTSGYDFGRLSDHAEAADGMTALLLAELAQTFSVHIVGGSYPVRSGTGVQNTSFVFNRDGQLIHQYSKVHLIGLMQEDQYLHSGDRADTFTLEGVKAGLIICYDLRFPELSRKMALDGAGILFIPAEWPIQRSAHWKALLIARAIENQMFVVAANMTGHNENDRFAGQSMIVSPWGEILLETGDAPGVYCAGVNLEQIAEIRRKIPVFQDRRPGVYT